MIRKKERGVNMGMGKRKILKESVKDCRGMITIEACIILPITLMITVLILWVGFFWYNRNAITHAVSMALIAGSQAAEKSNSEVEEIVQSAMSELLEGKLVMMDPPQMTVSVGYGNIEMDVAAQMELPGGIFITDIYDDGVWNYNVHKECRRVRRSQIIRTVHRLSEALSVSENEVPQSGSEGVTPTGNTGEG